MKALLALFIFIFATNSFADSIALDSKAVVPEIVRMGIPVTVRQLVDNKFQDLSYDEDKYYLEIKLGSLTEKQFIQLQSIYGHYNYMKYQVGRSYDLIDFLPVTMQALVNQTYTPKENNVAFLEKRKYQKMLEDENNPDAQTIWAMKKNGLYHNTNCHNTTLLNLQLITNPASLAVADAKYNLELPGRWEADEIFKSKSNNQLIQPTQVKVYDVLLVNSISSEVGSAVQHSATFIGKNLVFEKTDTSESDPYRIALYKDVYKKYKKLFKRDLKLEIRRYGPQMMGTPNEPVVMPEVLVIDLMKFNRNLSEANIKIGNETAMGGGYDPYAYESAPVTIQRDPKTLRGVLQASPNILKGFVKLKSNEEK
jgi:hypothetical protein